MCRGDFAEAGNITAKTQAIADTYEDEGSLTKYPENLA